MFISGITFVRNALVFGYPILESIQSLIPLCDELIIAAGKSDDNTLEVLKSIKDNKITIIETEWDETLKKSGLVYSQQTNLALENCRGDWCIYLQADEVLHEKDMEKTLEQIHLTNKKPNVDGLLFRYKHFYGSYDYLGVGRQWYRREIRAFRNTGNIVSWGDAQGFRKKTEDGYKKLRAIQTDCEVYHYGWVRPPKSQFKKIKISRNYYYENADNKLGEIDDLEFDYTSAFELEKFYGSHPSLMKQKIENDKIWADKFNPKKLKPKPFLVKLSDSIEKKTGWRIGEFKDFIDMKI